jgi:hypothetical protein
VKEKEMLSWLMSIIVKILLISKMVLFLGECPVNKMLKTTKKMFTITSFTSGGGGSLSSKFETQY